MAKIITTSSSGSSSNRGSSSSSTSSLLVFVSIEYQVVSAMERQVHCTAYLASELKLNSGPVKTIPRFFWSVAGFGALLRLGSFVHTPTFAGLMIHAYKCYWSSTHLLWNSQTRHHNYTILYWSYGWCFPRIDHPHSHMYAQHLCFIARQQQNWAPAISTSGLSCAILNILMPLVYRSIWNNGPLIMILSEVVSRGWSSAHMRIICLVVTAFGM